MLYNFKKIKKDSITTVYDFDIDSGDTTMIVLAYNKIMHFKNTGSGFDYVKSIKLKRILPLKMDFVPGTNKILLSTILNRRIFGPALYVIIDKEGDTLNFNMTDFKRFNPEEHEIFNEIFNYNFANRIYLKELFNDTVISIDTDSLIFNNAFILDSRLSGTNSENINDPEHFKMLSKIESILEVSRYLYFFYSFYHSSHEVFYDKNEDKRYEVDPKVNGLKDDIAGGPNFIPKYCSEGKMYSWISARALKKYSESVDLTNAQAQNTQKQEDLKNLFSSLNESDNPILILLRLKN